MAGSETLFRLQQNAQVKVNDTRKTMSDVLKHVESLIHKGDLDEADQCVAQAREIDPKNIYAYAFQERIANLKEQAHQKSAALAGLIVTRPATKEPHDIIRTSEKQKHQNRSVFSEEPAENTRPTISVVLQGLSSGSQEVKEPIRTTVVNFVYEDSSTRKPVIQPVIQEVPMEDFPVEQQAPSDEQPDRQSDRGARVQQLIKNALEVARKENEQRQSSSRVNDEDLAQKALKRNLEAVEAARKAEEARKAELRKKQAEYIQQKVREALQRKDTAREMPDIQDPRHTGNEESSTQAISAGREMAPERRETLERYKLVLSSVWADGAVSDGETSTLNQLRQALSISTEEHHRMEKEVQHETYIEAFRKAWNSGTITPESASVLAELRQRFNISDEEHLAIESKILCALQPAKNRPTLLVIDDDERLLITVSKTLTDAGFNVTPFTTSDQAYAYLKKASPDLILCDVNLETSTMGGFAFYEKVRAIERLRETPFVFLSGLSDEALVRSGKELGADDYLSKPISEETLVATIKGKLRRYHDLKRRMN